MDKGTLEHVAITLVLTWIGMVVGVFSGHPTIGAVIGYALACGIFIGRELAQAEYRWIKEFGDGLRANMPRFAYLRPVVWDLHDYCGLFAPIGAGGAFVTALHWAIPLIKTIAERMLT